MSYSGPTTALSRVVRRKPLQAGKAGGILLALVLGIAGFVRLIDAEPLLGESLLADGQFLALLLLPLLGLALVGVVALETLVTGYRVLRADASVLDQVTARPGYVLVRGVEAAIAVGGVVLMAAAIPPLVADSTPAPAGVGIMLLLFVVGLAILAASLLRATVELVVYTDTT